MQIDTAPIKNKQRIYIGGTRGVEEIFDLCQLVVNHVGKEVDFYSIGEETNFTDAPVIIIKGGDEKADGKPYFHDLDLHILLIHRIGERLPAGYQSFDEVVLEYEKLADQLPKAGSLVYFEDDHVATMIGKKEREDVKSFEYKALKCKQTDDGFIFEPGDEHIVIRTDNEGFPNHAAGAKMLLGRIGISKKQFYSALKTLA